MNYEGINKGFNNLRQHLSTGSNLKDFGIGASVGFNQSQPFKYYTMTNWAGDGLARTGLGVMKNPNYTNPYDRGQAMGAVLHNNEEEQRKRNGILGRLGGLFNRRKGNVIGNQGGNTLGNFIDNEANGYQLQPETTMDYLQRETNYGGYTPQFLPSSYDERGGFDNIFS